MDLDGRLEWNEEKKLVVRAALYPILGGRLAVVERAGLGLVEQNLDGSRLLVRVEQLAVAYLNLVCDVAVASRDVGALPPPTVPAGSCARGFCAQARLHHLEFGDDLAEHGLDLARVEAGRPLDDLGVTEDQERRDPGDFVFSRDVAVLGVVDLGKGDEFAAREVEGEPLEVGSDLLARLGIVFVDCAGRVLAFLMEQVIGQSDPWRGGARARARKRETALTVGCNNACPLDDASELLFGADHYSTRRHGIGKLVWGWRAVLGKSSGGVWVRARFHHCPSMQGTTSLYRGSAVTNLTTASRRSNLLTPSSSAMFCLAASPFWPGFYLDSRYNSRYSLP